MLNLILKNLLIIIFSFYSLSAQVSSFNYIWMGRVIDNEGKSVSNARIYMQPELSVGKRENAIDGLITFTESDINGKFMVKESQTHLFEKELLFISASPPSDAYNLFNFPNFKKTAFDKPLFGYPIKVIKNGVVDVGDLKVQIYYRIVTISLVDKSGNALYTKDDDWEDLNIFLYNKNGEFITNSLLSSNAVLNYVNVPKSSIKIALPDGTWRLKLVPNVGAKNFLTRKIIINKFNTNQRISLTVK